MEKVIYQGRVYSRNPDAKNQSRRIYYRRKRYDPRLKKEVHEVLHRKIWEDANGPIPFMHIIHHIDRNPDNNELSNLACISEREHLSRFHKGKLRRNLLPEMACVRCGKSFKPKSKKSRFCIDCLDI